MSKYVLTFLVSILILTSCGGPRQAQQQEAISAAQTAVSGEMAYSTLVGASTIEAVLPQLIAIENNLAGARGSWMLINDCSKIAVFITNAGKGASGLPYYFIGTVDIASSSLVDTGNILADYGIDFSKITNFEEMESALKSRGFVRMAPAAFPTLYATLKMALSFIARLGTATTDIIIMPAGLLTPEVMFPYCREINCVGVQQ